MGRSETGSGSEGHYDAVVVGAGFAGMYMLHRLREAGFSARVFEAGAGVGGTWFWNRYPGARCDVESMQYSYGFSEELQQEWSWNERYAPQPEILAYANHVADRFDLRRDIQFDTRVTAAHFEDGAGRWHVETDAEDRVSAQFCIMATGCLSVPNIPHFEGMDAFEGDRYHTGDWPQEGVDFTGKRVAMIGTGSSAIQSTPVIAEQADELLVFQRTAGFSIPAHNGPLDREYEGRVKAEYPAFRDRNRQTPAALASTANDIASLSVDAEERRRIYEERWEMGGLAFLGAFNDLAFLPEANATAADFVRNKIHEIVEDADVADALSPTTLVGCKRLCVDTDYYATFNRPNVSLVDVSEKPIERITKRGVQVGECEYPVDAIVLATGFDAMTGALLRIDIRGRGGRALADVWAEGPKAYLGLGIAGFPNLFTITGPGSPSVLANMVVAIEQHVDWIHDCIVHLRGNGFDTIEANVEEQEAWVGHVNDVASLTLFKSCNSWYLGANVPGKPRVFMPYIGFPAYAAKCEEVVADGYAGFTLQAAAS